MGKRKQPFGYQIQMGQNVILPSEAELVKAIFTHYISGFSYNDIVQLLRKQAVPYDEAKLWNKNMVARILSDPRYVGNERFPPIIETGLFDSVQEKRRQKDVLTEHSHKNKLLRQLSGQRSVEKIEKETLNLLNYLIQHPEQIISPSHSVELRSLKELQSRLDQLLHCSPMDECAAHALILEIAACRYEQLDSNEYETERLKRLFNRQTYMTELDIELLRSTVKEIIPETHSGTRLLLQNNQFVERSKPK